MSIISGTYERIKSLPPTPQAVQFLQRVAQNPADPNAQTAALIKLNEIKTAQQAIQAQQAMQQGGAAPTIKDQILQGVSTMGVQNARAQQGIQQLAQQAGQGASPVPGTGNPVQAASGGLMSLPVRRFNGAEGSWVEDEEDQEARNPMAYLNPGDMVDAIKRWRASGKPLLQYLGGPSIYKEAEEPPKEPERTEAQRRGSAAAERLYERKAKAAQQSDVTPLAQPKPVPSTPAAAPDSGGLAPTPTATPAAPTETPEDLYKRTIEAYLRSEAPQYKDPSADLPENLRTPVGSEYAAHLERLATQGKDRDAKFAVDQAARDRENVFASLMAAGRAAHGQHGLAGLAQAMGGFGQSLVKGNENQRTLAAQQAELMAEAEAKRQSAMFNLEKLRREEALGHHESGVKTANKNLELAYKAAEDKAGVARQALSADALADLQYARARNPGGTSTITAEQRWINSEINRLTAQARLLNSQIKDYQGQPDLQNKARLALEGVNQQMANLQRQVPTGGAAPAQAPGGAKILTDATIARTIEGAKLKHGVTLTREQVIEQLSKQGWRYPTTN